MTIADSDSTAKQLAGFGQKAVKAHTQYGPVNGGRVANGVQVFLNVPYGSDVPRWSDPQGLQEGYSYPQTPFVVDGKYAAQPLPDHEVPGQNRLGQGRPTENPFFADIFVPSTVDLSTCKGSLPVRVFIHGGALQHGSTAEDNNNQQFYRAEAMNEIRVLLAYRLSVFGFLAATSPPVAGNFGFKDCQLGLQWVHDNIRAFGGDPDQVHLSGLSAGAHIVHQLLHHTARNTSPALFRTATLHSNAILTDPVSISSRQENFDAFCCALGVDPNDCSVMDKLRDTKLFSTDTMIDAVQGMGNLSTFRGVAGSDDWVEGDQRAFQQDGKLARGLKEAGVRCVIVGDVRDEDCFYSTQHPCDGMEDVLPNLCRYYPLEISCKLFELQFGIKKIWSIDAINAGQGRLLADMQSHLAVRLLADDLEAHGCPTVRYSVHLALQSSPSYPKVTHGSDLAIHHLRRSVMNPDEAEAAATFVRELEARVAAVEAGEYSGDPQLVLLLDQSGDVRWVKDERRKALEPIMKVIRS